MLHVNSSSSSTAHMRLPSVPENELHYDELNMTPQAAYHSDSSITELMKEVATLESEVIHLERYLLSLYRAAFEHYVSTWPCLVTDQGSRSRLQSKTRSQLKDATTHSYWDDDIDIGRGGRLQQSLTFPVCDSPASNNQRNLCTPSVTSKKDHKNGDSGLRTLADHFGAPLSNHIHGTASQVSGDIIRCIASIYCKLSKPPLPYMGVSASPASSLSSSNTFSQQDDRDKWSPKYNEEDTCLKQKNRPYNEMVEVPKICLDDDRFNYAANKLKTYRSLVQHLEKVDPKKMKREEKLAFWINIHNALVMHAYLAYGIHRNHMKNAPLLLKASYNVGGHCVNAYTIQTSILGCRQGRSASWLQTFFSPGTKLPSGSGKHTFALDYMEPLVHFALCSGAYSDPAVRVYSAKGILKELHVARDEFIQASVSIYKNTKIVLPKILHYFAKDAALNLYGLLDMVHACLPEAQQKAMQTCRKGRPNKYIEWLSYNTAVRYIVHTELAKVDSSI